MLINNASFRDEVRRIVSGFTKNAALQEDLRQEAMIHAWRVETEKPDRTRSWYLQSCRFHLQHWLALGRSVDSLKRVTIEACVLIDEVEFHEYHTNGECFESVSFQDLVLTLSKRLRPAENGVLQGLANGMRLREVAQKLGLSYPTALKYRRRIAELVSRLEQLPVSSRTRLMPVPSLISRRSSRPCPKRACAKNEAKAVTPDEERTPPASLQDRQVAVIEDRPIFGPCRNSLPEAGLVVLAEVNSHGVGDRPYRDVAAF